jgi:Asp-tRNA(Asn)/Glu-tRNA(Gln) amidotransferase A subunit family amidase
MAFDYTAIADTPDGVVRAVAAEMSDSRLKPLSDQERLERAHWRKEQALLAKKLSAERERHEQERDAIARAEEAAEIAAANRKRRLEREAEISRQVRDREIRDLRFQSAQHQAWQNSVTSSFRQTLANRQRQATIAEIDAIINPPAPTPAPEPQVVYIEQPTENTTGLLPKLDYPKLRSWWFD